MRQIRYNNSGNVVRFEFPSEWSGSALSAMTLTVNDRNGDELLSAQAVTLYTATTLGSAAARFAGEIILAAGAGALSPGDPILIAGASGAEKHRVKGYSATTRTVTLEGILENAHDSGDAVYGLWGVYTLDTTTVATWPKGLVCTLIWTPTGTGIAVTESAQISYAALDIEMLERRFSRLYPRAYNAFTRPVDRFADMVAEAEIQLASEVDMDIQRIVDQEAVGTALMAKMAFLWTLDGDEQMIDERKFLAEECQKHVGYMTRNAMWTDSDQDTVEDTGELSSHPAIFERGY
jgi:hypothetical protein